jgi:hypothetical protein
VDVELQKTIVRDVDTATLVKAIADLVEVKGNLGSAGSIPGELQEKIRAVVRHGTVADLISLARTVVQPPPPTFADPQPRTTTAPHTRMPPDINDVGGVKVFALPPHGGCLARGGGQCSRIGGWGDAGKGWGGQTASAG